MSRASKIRARKFATRKVFGCNEWLIEGRRVQLDEHGRVPTPMSQPELERLEEQARQNEQRNQRVRAERAKTLFSQESPELTAVTEEVSDNVRGTVSEIRLRITEALTDAQMELQRESGIFLTDSGLEKLRALSRVNLTRNWLSKDVWLAGFDLIQQCQAFTADDYSVHELPELPATEAVPEHSLDDVLREESTQTKSGDLAIKRAVVAEFTTDSLAVAWNDSLKKNFGIGLSSSLFDDCWQYLLKMNLSPYDPKTYDRLRVWMVQSGRLPESCLTVGEVLSQRHDAGTLTDRDYLVECRRWKEYLDSPRKAIEI